MRCVFSLLLSLLVVVSAVAKPAKSPAATRSPVIHLAPDFSFPAAGNKARSLRSLRGQPVVLFIAASAETKLFRKQVALLRRGYSKFASRQAIFVAALGQGGGPIASNVPFVVANNGDGIAGSYGVSGKFAVAIIGKDGNLDYQTDKVLPPERILDVIGNGYPVQEESRREIQR